MGLTFLGEETGKLDLGTANVQVQQETTAQQVQTTHVLGSETQQTSTQEQFGFEVKDARIMVVGSGGGGCNTVNRLTNLGVKGAKTIALNTDARHLSKVNAHKKILIGKELTRGLGAGGYPDVGKRAAEESIREIKEALKDCDMLYALCGLGGGTGTGSLPVVAKIAKEMGAIVIGCVTLPFRLEGSRVAKAEDGLERLRSVCDTVIAIENDRLVKVAGNLPLDQAFAMADNLVATMIKGITETISEPSLVNLDYADVRTIMHSGGIAAIGFAESDTKNRAEEAVVRALSNPLLEVDYAGGSGALIHITGGDDLKLDEVNLIGEYVSKQLSPEAQVIWGTRIEPNHIGKVRVITIVTGVKTRYDSFAQASQQKPTTRNPPTEMGIRSLVFA